MTTLSPYSAKVSSIYWCYSILVSPNYYQILLSYWVLRKEYGCEMIMNKVFTSIFLSFKMANRDWFYLRPYANCILIEKLLAINKGWKDPFFMVDGDFYIDISRITPTSTQYEKNGRTF